MKSENAERAERTERIVAFIVARLSSSRLPAKHFRKIGDRSILEWSIFHLRKSETIDDIVIATVAEEANQPLRDFAREQGIPCFWYEGDVNHVTTRLRRAAETYNADICLLISGDCPLQHAPVIDRMVRSLRADPEADYVTLSGKRVGEQIAIQGLGVARREAWQRADDMSDRPELKEHHFPIIKREKALFRRQSCEITEDLLYSSHPRFSIDTWADLEFMRAVHDALAKENRAFDLENVIALLGERPELGAHNAHVHQRRLVEDIKNVLYVASAFDDEEPQAAKQDIQFAQQIVDRLSWPVTFLTDDEKVEASAKERGFRTIEGALRAGARAPWELAPGTSLDGFHLIIIESQVFDALPPDWRDKLDRSARVVVLVVDDDQRGDADLAIARRELATDQAASERPEGPSKAIREISRLMASNA